jgi:hypothetical protein
MKINIIFLFSILFLTTGLAQTKIKNFDELLSALKEGKQIRVIIYYAKCKLVSDSSDTKSPDAIGGMDISNFEYFAPMSINNPKAILSCSKTVLINHYKRGYVYNYIKLKFYDDNNVNISAKYLATNNLNEEMNETFTGIINDYSNDGGVSLFAR